MLHLLLRPSSLLKECRLLSIFYQPLRTSVLPLSLAPVLSHLCTFLLHPISASLSNTFPLLPRMFIHTFMPLPTLCFCPESLSSSVVSAGHFLVKPSLILTPTPQEEVFLCLCLLREAWIHKWMSEWVNGVSWWVACPFQRIFETNTNRGWICECCRDARNVYVCALVGYNGSVMISDLMGLELTQAE